MLWIGKLSEQTFALDDLSRLYYDVVMGANGQYRTTKLFCISLEI